VCDRQRERERERLFSNVLQALAIVFAIYKHIFSVHL